MARRGDAIFAARLARLEQDLDDRRLHAIARRVAAGPSVAVHGRSGVGRSCVSRGLMAAGVAVCGEGDVDLHVVAEVVKPEDAAAIAASTRARPTLAVLNKADLIADPRDQCSRVRALTTVITVPMAAHLASVEIDDGLFSALRMLAAAPCDVGSVDDFVIRAHTLSAEARMRLLETLDLYGIARAVPAVRAGADADAVRQVLRRASGVDHLVLALAPMLAEAAYRRVSAAIAELEEIVATSDNALAERVEAFLVGDDAVLARMAAAVDVMKAAGVAVDPADNAAAHLTRARQWQRYRRGPVNPLHRACGADIERGSLRLWRRVAP